MVPIELCETLYNHHLHSVSIGLQFQSWLPVCENEISIYKTETNKHKPWKAGAQQQTESFWQPL